MSDTRPGWPGPFYPWAARPGRIVTAAGKVSARGLELGYVERRGPLALTKRDGVYYVAGYVDGVRHLVTFTRLSEARRYLELEGGR